MMSFTRKTIYIFIFAAAALVLGACSAQAEKLNQDGNEAFAEQAYMEALELYQSAQVESPELAEPYFNAANTYYRQGDFPAALEQMQMALQYIDEETLAESSYYNLGNTLFNTQELDTAVEAYTQSLLLNPDGQDAKYNLELALQQQEQQQEQNQDQNEDSQDQSQEQGGEGQDSENQENEDPQNGENQEENNEDQEGDQSQNNDQQGGDQESEQQNSSGEPQEGDNQPDQQPSQTPQPGQRMTEEQARQLLAALSDDMQTLQEKLGQYLFARQLPPAQDW